MTDVYYQLNNLKQSQLKGFIDKIKDSSSTEVLLDWVVNLTRPITKETMKGCKVFFMGDNAQVVCFDTAGKMTESFRKALAEKQPLRVVFRYSGFKNDSVKVNIEQVFKLMCPHTDIKTV